ncbi:transporter [Siccirubricoccus deserti]|uniref:AEC family transporter n=1 Tax=Siccirubricoccus deserti TaxID=2013562 RepID=A0A9X0UCU7_9PROT|nr:AEC family transporter [Siccirubricoccus deserti]MBC4014818.1 AEC family transporter [Siccirubricoccus deserti]GGC35274.1 transporter [Siccirubricoccus deserti]
MLSFLSLCAPIFAIIGLGWAAARFRMVQPAMVDAVGTFSFHFALPALLLRLMGSQPLGHSFEPVFFAGYLAVCLSIFFATMLLALPWRRRGPAAALGAAAAMGNVGYLGPPLLLPLLGERGAGPIAMAIMSEVAVVLALGSLLMAPAMPGAGLRAMGRALRALLVNPVLLAIAGGALLGAAAIPLPGPVDRFLGFLGGAAGPTALFALGGTLGRLAVSRKLLAVAGGLSLAKLALYPLLVWLLLGVMLQRDGFWVQAGVMLAAMPTASNAFIMAQRNMAAAEEVSATVLLSTLLAAACFPLTAWLVTGPLAVP